MSPHCYSCKIKMRCCEIWSIIGILLKQNYLALKLLYVLVGTPGLFVTLLSLVPHISEGQIAEGAWAARGFEMWSALDCPHSNCHCGGYLVWWISVWWMLYNLIMSMHCFLCNNKKRRREMWSIIDILLKQNNGLPNNKIGTKFAQSFLTARSGIAIKPECVGFGGHINQALICNLKACENGEDNFRIYNWKCVPWQGLFDSIVTGFCSIFIWS